MCSVAHCPRMLHVMLVLFMLASAFAGESAFAETWLV